MADFVFIPKLKTHRPIPIDRADDPPGDAAPPQGVGGKTSKIYAMKIAHSDRRHSL
jgi:hypothetical protein